jgi:MazG family protein
MDGAQREHCEELGDLLFQIVFHSAIRSRAGAFDIDDVVGAITDKMRRRHPHVFAGTQAGTVDQLHAQWVQAKQAEKQARGEDHSVIDGVPRHAPALLRAWRIGEKASRVGFDWPDAAGARAKVSEELAELDHAIARRDLAAVSDELGDVLFAVVNLARKLELEPEQALREATRKFEQRFRSVEAEVRGQGRAMMACSPAELDAAWERAKRDQ